jgi:hypothetical protein
MFAAQQHHDDRAREFPDNVKSQEGRTAAAAAAAAAVHLTMSGRSWKTKARKRDKAFSNFARNLRNTFGAIQMKIEKQ